MILWVCGQLIGEWSEAGSVWAFQGVFNEEGKADSACKDETYFIFPANLNAELPHESGITPCLLPKSARYPRMWYPEAAFQSNSKRR